MRRLPRLPLAPLAAALVLALLAPGIAPVGAAPSDRSLREYRDPATGARVRPPRAVPSFPADPRSGNDSPLGLHHGDYLTPWRSGTYPERLLDELRAHHARDWSGIQVLPTSQSYDRGEIAVIEDDGTILIPTGAQVTLDPASLARRFLELHDDEYDYINCWVASNVTNLTLGGGFAYELNVRNEVEGIGLSIYDYGDDFGSNGVLKSFLNMNRLSLYPASPNTTFLGTNTALDVLGQEAGHRFAAFTLFDNAGTPSNALLGRSLAHWSFFHNSLASDVEGNRIRDNLDGTFTTIDATNGFSYLDEYLFGLRDSSTVDTLWYVASPTAFSPPGSYEPGTSPRIGVTFSGTKRFVDISQITALNGLRVPTPATSQKTFRMAWVLVVRNGEAPTVADLDKLESFRAAWGPYFAAGVEGLGAMDNTVNSVAGSVAIEHTPLKDTEDTASPRAIAADMFIRQRSLLIGFDASSPRLHWRADGGAWNEVVLAPAGGDTYAGSIPAQAANTLVDYWLAAASDSAGIAATLPAGAPAQFHRYRVGVDVTAPALAHVPPEDPSYLQLPLAVAVDASDNLGLDSVAVRWRVNSGPEQVAAVVATGDGSYAFAIGAGAGFGDVITYRFTGVDQAAAPNRAVLPSGGTPFALLVGGNFAETFESGEGGFAHAALSGGFFDEWHRSSQRNATPGGGWAWKCGATGTGPYRASLHAGLASGPITIGPGATLSFQHWYDLESSDTPGQAYDGIRVERSNDDGATWAPITPLGGYSHTILSNPDSPFPAGAGVWSGTSGAFVPATFDLSTPALQNIRLRWVLGSDSFVGGEGWYVDDVTVTYDGGQPIDVPLGKTSFALAAPTPNPSRAGRVTLAFALPTETDARLSLFDARGRHVRTLVDGPRPAGPAFVDWDGRDAAGRAVPAGVYFARLGAAGVGVRTTRLVVLP